MEKQIPVVFITDNNYVIPTGAAIKSLVLNKKPKTIYKIYVIVTENVTAENKTKLTGCGRKKAQVNLIGCDTSVLNEYVVPEYYVLPCALLKFDIPGLLPQYDKILYLDGDILVNGDLTELYETDISDAYLGAVSDMLAVATYGYQKRLGIVNYFNSGVMLLDSARMRQERLEEKLYRVKKQNPDYICMDQDVFNVAVQNKVVFFPVKYNVMLYNFLYKVCGGIAKLNEYYGTVYESFNALLKDAIILHLTNEFKPWKYKDAVLHKKWMSYFKKSPFRRQKLSLAYLIKKESLNEKIISVLLSLVNSINERTISVLLSLVYSIKKVNMKIKCIIKKILKNLPVIKQINSRYLELREGLKKNNQILERLEQLNQNIYDEIHAGKNNTSPTENYGDGSQVLQAKP